MAMRRHRSPPSPPPRALARACACARATTRPELGRSGGGGGAAQWWRLICSLTFRASISKLTKLWPFSKIFSLLQMRQKKHTPPFERSTERELYFNKQKFRDLPLKENFDVCEGDRGGSCRFQSPSLFLFPSVGWHGHWAAPERLHPGGRARPLLITYERTKSRTNEIYGGRYGPEGRGEAAEDITASSHSSRDEDSDR